MFDYKNICTPFFRGDERPFDRAQSICYSFCTYWTFSPRTIIQANQCGAPALANLAWERTGIYCRVGRLSFACICSPSFCLPLNATFWIKHYKKTTTTGNKMLHTNRYKKNQFNIKKMEHVKEKKTRKAITTQKRKHSLRWGIECSKCKQD